jgi:hypothetical protein
MGDDTITRTAYKVSDFVSWQRSGSLVLSPSFQRRPVWKKGAKSFLIDTVIRGLPMPLIFLRERPADLKTFEPKREVVDGQQRIRTLLSFVDPKILKDYIADRDLFTVLNAHNKEIANTPFAKLSQEFKQRILDYQFSVHVFPTTTDDRDILQIFARMNATGLKLNDQELRNAEYFGEFKTTCYQTAAEQLARWRSWKLFSEYSIARMDEVELTSELIMLILRGITGKTQSAIDKLYGDMDERFKERVEVVRRFRIVMESIDAAFGKDMEFLDFHKRTLFYCLFAAVYHLHFKLESKLVSKAPTKLSPAALAWLKQANDRIARHTAPEPVLEAAGRRTTHLSSRKKMISYLLKSSS